MKIRIHPGKPLGKIKAIASKSAAHRLLILAAFADRPCELVCEEVNDDITATADCLASLGTDIRREGTSYFVSPAKEIIKNTALNCRESGSTLRFLLPVAAAIGACPTFIMSGRLPNRPLSPLRELLEGKGAVIGNPTHNSLVCNGRIMSGSYEIDGGISSQFISGLLLALSLTEGESRITVTGKIESAPYINITLDALRIFGINVKVSGNVFYINSGRKISSPGKVFVEGDWSNAAFPLCASAISGGQVTVEGLDLKSSQGDREIVEILRRFGADITAGNGSVTVRGGAVLHGADVDAANIPDLVPIISVVAANARGRTVITGAARLKIKESDRLFAMREVLCTLGADVCETTEGLVINGVTYLTGGSVPAHGDHRIAMSAAVCALVCAAPVEISDAESVDKSYPDFWNHLNLLGICTEICS